MAISTDVIVDGLPPEREYPYLGITSAGQSELVVLFTAPLTGMALKAGPSSGWFVGAHHEAWAEKQFDIFHGKIVIENK